VAVRWVSPALMYLRCESANWVKIKEDVTSITTSAPSLRPANCRRALGYLLLLMITYGATMETVHSHGPVSADRKDVAAISDAGGSHSSNTGHSHHTECPMCQFQRQLFHGLVHSPLLALTPSTQIEFANAPAVVYLSTSTTPRRGRSPPVASLL
jgi:hypothetical protein